MRTSKYLEEILSDYAKKVYCSNLSRDSIDADFLLNIDKLANKFPSIFYWLCNKNISKEKANTLFERIRQDVKYNYLPIFHSSDSIHDIIGGKLIETPIFNIKGNGNQARLGLGDIQDFIISALIGTIISLPINKIKIQFIDLDKSYQYNFLLKNISPRIFGDKYITKERELGGYIDYLEERIKQIQMEYGDYITFCQSNKRIPIPYEIVIINDSMGASDRFSDKWSNIEENGNKSGIFIFYADISPCSEVKEKRQEMQKEHPVLLRCTPIDKNKNLLKACLEYINSEAEKEESNVIQQDFNKSASNAYEKNLETITVPIGQSSNTEVNFTMDMVSHVHSFIIGQSGSGKSVFLHNIIGSAILKYAPEDLQLYLLDFKLGGVEFNRYKGIKHVKSLLVDNSDQQITLEILRELRERMVERGRQLRDYGVNNLVEYNKQNPNATMPQILVVVDECHEMFRVGSDIPRTVSNEISEIITKIAKEGRSQGVHLILATQTLSGTEISNEILNNVSDHYLLKCATSDSERMVEKSSEITSQLSTGQIYYHHVDSQVQFQAYYTDKENAAKLVDLAKKKAENHQSNGEFYFNGSQLSSWI